MSSNPPWTVTKPGLLDGKIKLYGWLPTRRVPPGGWYFSMWSKHPNYWTGFILNAKGSDHLRVLHKAAEEEATTRGIDINRISWEAHQAFEDATSHSGALPQAPGVGEQVDDSLPHPSELQRGEYGSRSALPPWAPEA